MFEGRVTLIDPRIDPVTRTAKLTAEFPNPDETLKPGMFLSVALEVTNKPNAVVVPEEAIVGEGLRHLLFVVKDDKTIDRRVVRIGQRQSTVVEILDGVKPGETIVVRGVQRVRPGMVVVPRPVTAGSLSSGDRAAAAPERRT
jgi:membrane fusion protein (multidrug efflux system)